MLIGKEHNAGERRPGYPWFKRVCTRVVGDPAFTTAPSRIRALIQRKAAIFSMGYADFNYDKEHVSSTS
ncbi:hypothetical protein CEP54_012946 [Fusarium duplospermum]|uniref:Uncharacterized protein n=1 Tax=Fusarium duplospermum TaxID=1325734 RepID=A0A428P5X1_9HYPO|nr:hypothetical protein CEP54_012946 [Fusarium duplospermum]